MSEAESEVLTVLRVATGDSVPAGPDEEIVFDGEVERQLLGQPGITRVTVMRVPVGRRPEARANLIALACKPLPVPALPPPPTPQLAPGGAPFMMVHVLRFAEGGEAAMARYGMTAGLAGLALGVRPVAQCLVEATMGSDPRQWDQVRFNRFPSYDTYEQLRAAPAHAAEQGARAAALTDTFALMVRPLVDRLGDL